MFLTLNHKKLDVYQVSKQFLVECYRFTKHLPPDEKFGMGSQVRRAALSVHPNIAEGASRKSVGERKRFFEISRGSLIEIDAALEVATDLGYFGGFDQKHLETTLIRCFKLLTGLINSQSVAVPDKH